MIDVQRTAEMMANPVRDPVWPDFPQAAADVWKVSKRRIMSPRFHHKVVSARHAGIWAAREYGCTYEQIGQIFQRDRTTCMNGVKAANHWRDQLPWYAAACDLILERARG